MNYRQLLQEGRKLLSCLDNGSFDASQLMEAACGMTPQRLLLEGETPVPPSRQEAFLQLCRRRAERYPLQYLLGSWDFYGRPFSVGEGVLIPRGDTEIVVEQALSLLQGSSLPVVADLCSGSGCIAVTIAKEHPCSAVYAVELSPQALPYLRRNVREYSCPALTVVEGDVLSWTPPQPLDMVVSNPPYITPEDMACLQEEVACEPAMALAGGRDGLMFYREIIRRYFPFLKQEGWLVFELGYGQYEAVSALMEAQGFSRIGVQKDYGGVKRAVFGQK